MDMKRMRMVAIFVYVVSFVQTLKSNTFQIQCSSFVKLVWVYGVLENWAAFRISFD